MCEEKTVNCQDFESAINSLTYIFNVDRKLLLDKLSSITIEDAYADAKSEYEFHFFMCRELGLSPLKIEKIVWFHFSKSLNPTSYYTKGLLPTNKILELLKDDIFDLAKDDFNKGEWNIIWEQAIYELPKNDRCKFTSNPPNFGPNGMMIKDAGLYPGGSTGYFFERPEIVEGILRTIDKKKSTHIWKKFSDKGQSCVVTFIDDCDRSIEMVTTPILYYIFNKINSYEFGGMDSCANYNGKNLAIPPEKILNVQTIVFNNKIAVLHDVTRQFLKQFD